jgi:transposase-like protein
VSLPKGLTDHRIARGEAIANKGGQIRRMDENQYRVRSQSGLWYYDVVSTETGWTCSCPDTKYHGSKCKHIIAVEFSFAIRMEVRQSVIVSPITSQACPYCGSETIIRHGIRHNDSGDLQRLFCKGCSRWFVINLGFERMHATPQAITQAMQLYFTGESLRNVQRFLALQGVNVSHVSVFKWIRKYVGLMESYLDSLKPNLSDTWRADELFVKVKGDMKFLFAMMDDETRFWIAQQITDTKFTADVRPLFAEGKRVAGKRPLTLITDGGQHFIKPFRKEFWQRYSPQTKHVRDIRLDGTVHNNKMERLNGEMRDREKVFRGLKKTDSPVFKGYQLFHNYLRPHEGLDGKTPADMAGIRIEGENKWITLIQNAANRPRVADDQHPQ